MPLNPADIRTMAERYAKAWSSHSPDAVASFYEEDGRITINDGDPVVGRAAIADVAQGFYNEFPDLVVRLDEVRAAGNRAVFMWTLEGTNSGPGGSGHAVKISGWEAWLLSDAVRVSVSDGRFDAVEYERQLAEGV